MLNSRGIAVCIALLGQCSAELLAHGLIQSLTVMLFYVTTSYMLAVIALYYAIFRLTNQLKFFCI